MNLFNNISDYIHHRLSETKMKQFENELNTNYELRKAYLLELHLYNNALREKVVNAQRNATQPQAPTRMARFSSWAVAASLLFLLGLGFYLISNKQEDKVQIADNQPIIIQPVEELPTKENEKTVVTEEIPSSKTDKQTPKNSPKSDAIANLKTNKNNTFQPSEVGTHIRGVEDENEYSIVELTNINKHYKSPISAITLDELADAKQLVMKGQYEAALVKLSAEPTTTEQVALLKAIALFESKQYENAARILMPMYKNPNAIYPQTQWMLGWSFYMQGKTDAAKTIFKKVAADANHPFQREAENLLNVLE
ncbi:MAG: hypothetical protein WAS72_00730 [Saprospiraceae bacterium]